MQQQRVYCGRRIYDGKLHHFFADAATPANYQYYWKKAKAAAFLGCRIGHIYNFEDGKMPATWESQGKVDEELRLELQAADQAAASRANMMKLKPAEELEDLVRKLAQARGRLSGPQAAAFDAWVLSRLRQGW